MYVLVKLGKWILSAAMRFVLHPEPFCALVFVNIGMQRYLSCICAAFVM
jgi:hypothetical protein